MSQRIKKAISQLRAIEPNQNLAERTVANLGDSEQTVPNLSLRIVIGLAVALAMFVLIALLPPLATASTLESIRDAVTGKVVHTRVYVLNGVEERLMSESWTDGLRRRNSALSHTTISDGSVTVALNHQYKIADITKDPGYKYAPSGFDIDSVLSDMMARDRSSNVKVKTVSSNGVDKLVVEFRGRIADYTIHCDPGSRLPETMRIVPTSPLSADKSPLLLRFEYLADAGNLFSTEVPEGYKVYDLRQGFSAYAQSSLIAIAEPEFKLFRLDINERGEVFALCASNAEFEIDLGIEEGYAGPIRLESLDKASQPRIDKLRAHFLAWVVPVRPNGGLDLTIRLTGKPAVTKRVRARRINGRPEYYSLASHILTDRVDVPLDELHTALQGVRQLPIVREGGLIIGASFDPASSVLTGSVHNSTKQTMDDVAIVFKLLGSGPWANGRVVQVGEVLPGRTVKFSKKLAERIPGGPLPLLDVVYASLYDPAAGIRISPYRRR